MDLKEFTEGEGNNDINVTTAEYKRLFQELFDYSGLNNGLKPKLKVGNESLLPDYFTWLESIGMTSRGHLLMWPGRDDANNHLTASVLAIVQDIEAEQAGNNDPAVIDPLKIQLKEQIDAELVDWAGKWNVTEWDVVNEVLGNYRIQAILGDSVLIDWFHLAETTVKDSANSVNPECEFFD